MKKIIFLLVLLSAVLFSSQLKAQDSIFDLKNYKTTDYERSSLDLNFNLGESTENSKNEYGSSDTMKIVKSNYFLPSLDIESQFWKTVYSEEKIVNYGLSLNISDNMQSISSKPTNESERFKAFNYNGNHQISGFFDLSDYYSNSNRNYFLFGGDVSFYLNYTRGKIDRPTFSTTQINKTNRFTPTINLKLGHGHGRIENVEDAVEAMYILKELSENGLLLKKYSGNDIKTLADGITLVRKERYFDERLYRQKSMKEMVSILEKSGLISTGNIDIFNTIADYHYYAGIPARQSGHKLEYYLNPGLQYSILNSSESGDNVWKRNSNELQAELKLVAGYYNYKPISMKWQRNVYVEGSLYDTRRIENITYTEETQNQKNTNLGGYVSAGYSYGYYPSTRSYISAGLSANYGYSVLKNDGESIKGIYDNFYSELRINGYYYLSSKLRLRGECNIYSYNNSTISKDDNVTSITKNENMFRSNLLISLAYFLF